MDETSVFDIAIGEHRQRQEEDVVAFKKWLGTIFLQNCDEETAATRNKNLVAECIKFHVRRFRVMLLPQEIAMLEGSYVLHPVTLEMDPEMKVKRDWKSLLIQYLSDDVDKGFNNLQPYDINIRNNYIHISLHALTIKHGYDMLWADNNDEYEIVHASDVDGKRIPGTDTCVLRTVENK